ncbi:MAG: polysaccharide biosynthesis tyrosine autokinase [Actinobacteria bacterium]|nr:polysaccharide biosynthesis tyrosine autokinase [Actinomycetota bacterium]MBW3648935.1 polysaccharide biosynthesis tyrosine autokinase [Actinomycetota bacterium]
MELSQHFRTIWRRRWRILGASVVVAVLVGSWSLTRPNLFRASATLAVTSGRATAGESVTRDDTLFLTRTYAELAETPPVVADAALQSDLSLTNAEAVRRLKARAHDDVGFVTLSATGPSPGDATDLAAAGAQALIAAVAEQQDEALQEALAPLEAEVEEVGDRLAALEPGSPDRTPLQARYAALLGSATERRLQPVDRLAVISPARSEPSPVSPAPARDALLALLVALVVNSELTVVLAALSDRFSGEDPELEVTDVTGLPVLARIPARGEETMLEAFRTLRTNLMFMDSLEQVRTVAVVSVDPGAGKSFISVNLARAAATLDVPVVLVDADLRRPNAHYYLDVAAAPGLTELLGGRADLGQVLKRAPNHEGFHVITAGSPVTDASRIVGSQELSELLSRLDWAGLVVVDTPAASVFADALAVASHCDATVLVVDLASTKRRATRSMVEQLRQVGAKPIGVVVNRSEPSPRNAYYYRRGNGSGRPLSRVAGRR